MKFSFLLCLLTITCSLFAQQVEFERSTGDSDKYQVNCINDEPYPLTFVVQFKDQSTFESSVRLPYISTAKANGHASFYVKRVKGITPNFAYSYKRYMGCINAKPDLDYPYLLPVAHGTQTQMKLLNNFSEKHDLKNRMLIKDWYSMAFQTNQGDTVYAARQGIVCSVKDDGELEGEGYSMSTKENCVYLYHKDCTFARYSVLNEIFVKKGQVVEAGQPIAVTGGEKYDGGCHLRLSVSYLFDNKKENEDMPVGRAFVTPKFYVNDNGTEVLESKVKYTSIHPEEIIVKEMNKKEVEKYKKSKE